MSIMTLRARDTADLDGMLTPGCQISANLSALSISDAFLAQILRPYRPAAKYLKSARITRVRTIADCNRNEPALMQGRGVFAVPESCDSRRGGFNAPEFNICYNQLAYVLFGKCIEAGMLEDLQFLTLADFKRHQLPSWLIVSIASRFFGALDSDAFRGELTLDRAAHRGGTWFFFTQIAFSDAAGVKADGSVVLAFNPPRN